MKNKREFALNKSFFLFIILGVFILSLGFVAISEKISAWSIVICVAGLCFLVGGTIKEPFCYGFDANDVTLYFVFLPKERYLWKDIRSIRASKEYFSGSAIISLIFSRVYEINGKVEGTPRFYMQGLISGSFRTRRLLNKYWKRNIEK